jgi:hypothetical protein
VPSVMQRPTSIVLPMAMILTSLQALPISQRKVLATINPLATLNLMWLVEVMIIRISAMR